MVLLLKNFRQFQAVRDIHYLYQNENTETIHQPTLFIWRIDMMLVCNVCQCSSLCTQILEAVFGLGHSPKVTSFGHRKSLGRLFPDEPFMERLSESWPKTWTPSGDFGPLGSSIPGDFPNTVASLTRRILVGLGSYAWCVLISKRSWDLHIKDDQQLVGSPRCFGRSIDMNGTCLAGGFQHVFPKYTLGDCWLVDWLIFSGWPLIANQMFKRSCFLWEAFGWWLTCSCCVSGSTDVTHLQQKANPQFNVPMSVPPCHVHHRTGTDPTSTSLGPTERIQCNNQRANQAKNQSTVQRLCSNQSNNQL